MCCIVCLLLIRHLHSHKWCLLNGKHPQLFKVQKGAMKTVQVGGSGNTKQTADQILFLFCSDFVRTVVCGGASKIFISFPGVWNLF